MCLSTCLPVSTCLSLRVSPPVCLCLSVSTCLSTCLSLPHSACLSLPDSLCVSLPVCLYLSVSAYTNLLVYRTSLSTYLTEMLHNCSCHVVTVTFNNINNKSGSADFYLVRFQTKFDFHFKNLTVQILKKRIRDKVRGQMITLYNILYIFY